MSNKEEAFTAASMEVLKEARKRRSVFIERLIDRVVEKMADDAKPPELILDPAIVSEAFGKTLAYRISVWWVENAVREAFGLPAEEREECDD